MWITDKRAEPKADGLFHFKKRFNYTEGKLVARISADTRYKLFVNGREVLCGPSKGNRFVTYYETADLTPYLTVGENEILALVLHLNYRMASIHRTERTAFLFDGQIVGESGVIEDISSDDSWVSAPDTSFICTAPDYWCFTDFTERIDYTAEGSEFIPCEKICDAVFDNDYPYGEMAAWRLKEREIPQLTNTECKFVRVMRSDATDGDILSENGISVEPNTTAYIELDAGVHFTGTPHLHIKGSKGASVKITYAESYIFKDGWRITKKMRDDTDGIIYGMTDELILDNEAHVYEPFWLRTFRFIRIEITSAESPVYISDLKFFENKYPLEVSARFDSSDPDSAALWENSIRTVNNCMHETFEDCPYYEQTQYAMDSRLEMLFTYHLGADRRLAKKGLNEFFLSQYPDGMTQARFPSLSEQVIPGFALHVVYMAEDYLRFTPTDRKFVRTLMPKVDAILSWFDRLVDERGVVADTGYWRFLDWVKGWRDGSPGKGAMAAYSFMYALALKKAADMCTAFGYNDLAAEYTDRAERINSSAREYFYDNERGLFTDTENGGFSQHAQVWAVLSGAVSGDEATALMNRMLDEDELPICSYSMRYFLLRALEMAGLYDRAYGLLDGWRDMIKRGLTTWAEDDVQERSDCHGWGSLPIYEFSAVILGVRPIGYDGKAVEIRPTLAGLEYANGVVSTPLGDIEVDWTAKDGKFTLSVNGNGEKRVTLPDGTTHIITEQKATLFCAI